MDSPIIIACIAAVSALVSGSISAYVAVRLSRRNNEAAQQLELLKVQADQARGLFQLENRGLEMQLEALRDTAGAIQALRDSIRHLDMEALIDDPDFRLQLGQVGECCMRLEKVYSETHSRLPTVGSPLAHDAKNAAQAMANNILMVSRRLKGDSVAQARKHFDVFREEFERLTVCHGGIIAIIRESEAVIGAARQSHMYTKMHTYRSLSSAAGTSE